jgi:hypothetical protein
MTEQYNEYLTDIFGDLREIKSKKFPNSRFWKNQNGDIVLELKETKNLYVAPEIWYSFQDNFELSFFDTRNIIKSWLENNLNVKEPVPFSFKDKQNKWWKDLK